MNPGGGERRTSIWLSTFTEVSRGDQTRLAAIRDRIQAAADTHTADAAEVAVAVRLAASGAVRDAGTRCSNHASIAGIHQSNKARARPFARIEIATAVHAINEGAEPVELQPGPGSRCRQTQHCCGSGPQNVFRSALHDSTPSKIAIASVRPSNSSPFPG